MSDCRPTLRSPRSAALRCSFAGSGSGGGAVVDVRLCPLPVRKLIAIATVAGVGWYRWLDFLSSTE